MSPFSPEGTIPQEKKEAVSFENCVDSMDLLIKINGMKVSGVKLQGSQGSYSGEELERLVNSVFDNFDPQRGIESVQVPLAYITNVGGLRDKVKSLLENNSSQMSTEAMFKPAETLAKLSQDLGLGDRDALGQNLQLRQFLSLMQQQVEENLKQISDQANSEPQ